MIQDRTTSTGLKILHLLRNFFDLIWINPSSRTHLKGFCKKKNNQTYSSEKSTFTLQLVSILLLMGFRTD